MKQKGGFPMNRDCTLTRNERLILFWITKNSRNEQKKRVSNISRTKLSQLSGIKDLVTISEVTKSLEEKGCLVKAHKRDEEGKLLSCYHIYGPKNGYKVSHRMTEYELAPKELSLLLGLAAIRHKAHSKILLSDTEIYKKTDFSRNTFKKHIGKLIDLGLVKKGDDGYYSVSKDIFPIEKVTIPKELAIQMAEWYNIPFEGKDHLKKMFAFYAKDNFVNLRMNPKKFCLSLLGGCSMEQMKKSLHKEAKKRQQKPIEFSF